MDENPYQAPQTKPIDRPATRGPSPRNMSEILWRLAFGGFPNWLKGVMLLLLAATVLFVLMAIIFGRR